MSKIKSFRGKLADAAQETIHLHTNDGSMGYRIVKFQVMPIDANTAMEGTVQIFKVKQASIPAEIDFEDNTLLGAATIQQTVNNQDSSNPTVIFDNEIFNQDIYVVHDEKSAGAAAAVITQSATGQNYPEDQTIIFDNEIFNQDIYVTLAGGDYDASINYYIELEMIKLDLNENTVATLKDIRNVTEQ